MIMRRFAILGSLVLSLTMVTYSSSLVRLRVEVIAPASTPPGAKIYIAGNQGILGDWDPGKIALQHDHDSVWSGTFTVPDSTSVEFKITRGDWAKQAVYKVGEIPPNTEVTLQSDSSITVRPIAWADLSIKPSSGISAVGGVIGTVKYIHGLKGEGLEFARDVIVWLPPSYEKDSTARYPVLYMHDGQNIIDPSTSFIGYDWRVDEVSDSLIKAGRMKEVIVVGVYNSPDRTAEYADTKKGKAYMDFLIHTLKPLVDSTYRTLPDRENTAVMGSSMGGLISFLLAWRHPEVFSKAGCLSPVLPDDLIKEVSDYDGPNKHLRLYVDIGGVGLEQRLRPGCDDMIPVLEKKGFKMHRDLEWFVDPKAEHNERAWAARLWRPLTFLLGIEPREAAH